jgi:hypothetical protein
VASLGPAPAGKKGATANTLTAEDIESIVSRSVTAALVARDNTLALDALMAAATEKVGPPPVPKTPNDEVAELLAEAGI